MFKFNITGFSKGIKEKAQKALFFIALVAIAVLSFMLFQKKFALYLGKRPFSIKFVRVIGKKAKLKGPADVFFGENNSLYIVDSGNSRIIKFNIKGGYLRQWGIEGKTTGEFMVPLYGTAYGNPERIYVVDSGNSRFQVFTPDGRFVNEFGHSKSKNKRLTEPTYIGFANNKIYCANSGGNDILIYLMNGKFYEKKDPKAKGGKAAFQKPVSMAFSKKYIYVSDYTLSKILVFDKQFNYAGSIGTKGEQGSMLYHPVGIIYNDGYLYVANYGRSILTVFKLSKGLRVIKSYNFGMPGKGSRNFNHESNIAISANGNYLAVADTNSNMVVLYRILGVNS